MDVDIFNAVEALGQVRRQAPNTAQRVPPRRSTRSSSASEISSASTTSAVSFTINDERKKQVNMVSYFNAGTQWVTQKGNPKKVDPDNACGLNIGVQKGTVQVDDLTARSKKCTDAGKPRSPIVDADQGKVTTAVSPARPTRCSPTPRRPLRREADHRRSARGARRASTTRPPTAYVVPKDQTEFARPSPTRSRQLDRRHLQDDPDQVGERGRRHHRLRGQPLVTPADPPDLRRRLNATVDRPGVIHARPVRHPGRWVAIAVIVVSSR
jgi:hypothetical protein